MKYPHAVAYGFNMFFVGWLVVGLIAQSPRIGFMAAFPLGFFGALGGVPLDAAKIEFDEGED